MISAAEFARELLHQMESAIDFLDDVKNGSGGDVRLLFTGEHIGIKESLICIKRLAAKHGIELATPSGEPTKGTT